MTLLRHLATLYYSGESDYDSLKHISLNAGVTMTLLRYFATLYYFGRICMTLLRHLATLYY